jgi:hypothetical protein
VSHFVTSGINLKRVVPIKIYTLGVHSFFLKKSRNHLKFLGARKVTDASSTNIGATDKIQSPWRPGARGLCILLYVLVGTDRAPKRLATKFL